MTQESQSKSCEAEAHRATITQKEAEIQQLLKKFEEQQAFQRQESSRLEHEKKREVAAAVEELKTQLQEAEQAKGRAEEELASAQLQNDKLKRRTEEINKLKLATQTKVCCCKDCCSYAIYTS